MQQQQNDPNDPLQWKRNFNVAYNLCLIHQRAIVVPLRMTWGPQSLGMPCALALVMMALWAAFSRDPLLWGWIALWLICLVGRRVESLWLWAVGAKLHGWYDGYPLGIVLGRTERATKLLVEPLLVGGLGVAAYWWYDYCHFSPYGLPYFLLSGVFSLPFVEIVKQQIWQHRTQSMLDARLEQEALMRDFRNKYGQ